ncbi:MAG: hypothetical protein J6R04_00530 [Clostridia bacterium]|nr:hypothetical protein [Clostridia bacterium]
MKRRFLCLLFALLFVFSLFACRPSLAREVEQTLADIDVSEYTAASIMVPSYDAPSRYTERFPEEYARIAALGTEALPYLLDYVEQGEPDYLNGMFFVCCAYGMLGIDEWLDIDRHAPAAHARALRAYLA